MLALKLNSKALLFLVLLYPLLYAIPAVHAIGYLFSVFYFTAVLALTLYVNLNGIQRKFARAIWTDIVLLFLLTGLLVLNTESLRYSKPLFFVLYLLSFHVFCQYLSIKFNERQIFRFTVVYLLFSFTFFLLDHFTYDGRFVGFMISPTVYSIYLCALMVLVFFLNNVRTFSKGILYVLLGAFIYISKTRLNLLFFLLLPLLYYFRVNKLLLFLTVIISLNTLYPAYNYYIKNYKGEDVLVDRMDNKRDASFLLRYYLFNLSLEELEKGSVGQLLWGRGSEYTRLHVKEEVGKDLLPHNDFIRFTMDFGIVAMFLFLAFLVRIGFRNKLSFLFLLLYFFSFYHNMVYDFFLVSLILLSSNADFDIQTSNRRIKDLLISFKA